MQSEESASVVNLLILMVFLVMDVVYQSQGIPKNTNWDIFYLTHNYLLAAAAFYFQSNKYTVAWKWVLRGVSFMFVYSIYAELRYIGQDYEIYSQAVFKYSWRDNFGVVMMAIVLAIFIDVYARRLERNNT